MGSNPYYDLLMATYTEQLELWRRDVTMLEGHILNTQKELCNMYQVKVSWVKRTIAKLRHRKTYVQQQIDQLEDTLNRLQLQYEQRLQEEPNADRYELALLGNNVFKVNR